MKNQMTVGELRHQLFEVENQEIMNAYLSVFNSHINDAEKKAIISFQKCYNRKVYNKYIKRFVDNGIMGIFDESPNEFTKFFVSEIERIVNIDRV